MRQGGGCKPSAASGFGQKLDRTSDGGRGFGHQRWRKAVEVCLLQLAGLNQGSDPKRHGRWYRTRQQRHVRCLPLFSFLFRGRQEFMKLREPRRAEGSEIAAKRGEALIEQSRPRESAFTAQRVERSTPTAGLGSVFVVSSQTRLAAALDLK